MAIWDFLPEDLPPLPRHDPPDESSKMPENSFLGSFGDELGRNGELRKKPNSHVNTKSYRAIEHFGDFGLYYRGLDLIPVVLALDTTGKVQVRCNSLKTGILRFVGEHEAELAQALADLPGRKWDSMTDRVEELITRVQNAG